MKEDHKSFWTEWKQALPEFIPFLISLTVINDVSLQGIYKLSHSWVIIKTIVTTNVSGFVLKGILIQVSGVKPRKTRIVHCPPHMLDSNNFN
jgi:hypothetical protein